VAKQATMMKQPSILCYHICGFQPSTRQGSAAINQLMKESSNIDNIEPPIDAHLEDYPTSNFDSLFLLTFLSFKTNTIIARPVGGMGAASVVFGD
jgi:hypothetical protein